MNVILLAPEDWLDENTVCLDDHRHEHIRSVLKAEIGDALRVGLLDGLRAAVRSSNCLTSTLTFRSIWLILPCPGTPMT